jgi:hypothetical protein
MVAKTIVLPSEDAAAFQRKLDAWMAEWQPRGEYEHEVVAEAVRASWMVDRADRAETAHLSKIILDAVAAEDDRVNNEVDALGRQLLPDLYGPMSMEAGSDDQAHEPEASSSAATCSSADVAAIVWGLEATSTGCSWLRERWAELRTPLLEDTSWQAPETNRAIRLLGAEPVDAADVPEAARLIHACRVLGPHQDEASANGRLDGPASASLSPAQAEARQTLIDIVDQAMSRLKDKEDRTWEKELDELSYMTARLSFDTSKTGERLRQAHMYWHRSLFRSFDALFKMRRSRSGLGSGNPAGRDTVPPPVPRMRQPQQNGAGIPEFRAPIASYSRDPGVPESSVSGAAPEPTAISGRPDIRTQGQKDSRTQGLNDSSTQGVKDQAAPVTSANSKNEARPVVGQPANSKNEAKVAPSVGRSGGSAPAGAPILRNEARPAVGQPANSKNEANKTAPVRGCGSPQHPLDAAVARIGEPLLDRERLRPHQSVAS